MVGKIYSDKDLGMQPEKSNVYIENNVWKKLGIPSRGIALLSAIESGFPYEVFSKIAELVQMNERKLAASLSISSATLYRRVKVGHFNTKESDTLYRLIIVYSAVIELFRQDELAASIWLQSSKEGLGGNKPIEMLSTSAGTDAITAMLGQLEYGVFS